MKFGIRVPSLKKRLAARTSWKRVVRHSMGLKAPKGFGVFTNPKKALYNKVYNKTSVGIDKVFSSHKKSSLTNNSTSSSNSFIINVIIFLLLLVVFFPLAIVFLIYKLYAGSNKTSPQNPHISSSGLVNSFSFPEPTRSLLWITDEDTSKISSPLSIKIEYSLEKGTANVIDDSYNFFSEPSLIWTKLPIQQNNELETQKLYYSAYSTLTPKQRYQYLNWLQNVTQETNLSYVFLYYYGLERQMLIGDYNKAVDEVLRLIKYHDKGSFKSYAVNALIMASGYRKKPEIVNKAPFIFDEPSDVALYLQRMARKPLSVQQILKLTNRVGFTNKRYINLYPELFEQKLRQKLDRYQNNNGNILEIIDMSDLPNEAWASMANISLPDKIRTIKFKSITQSEEFKRIIKTLLEETHAEIKENLKSK